MSTDAGRSNESDTEKINVRVPRALLEAIDEAYERRGYTSRSEAIRDALRDWVDPPAELSEELLATLETSREQREYGETATAEEARERLGFED